MSLWAVPNVGISFEPAIREICFISARSYLYVQTKSLQSLMAVPSLLILVLYYYRLLRLLFQQQRCAQRYMLQNELYNWEYMTLELGWEVKDAKKKLIEESFRASQHRHYRMPRLIFDREKQSIEDIPLIYNLYTQNTQNKQVNLLPLKQLIQLKTKFDKKARSGTKKRGAFEQGNERQGEEVRRSRIHRTLSKNSSHLQVKQLSRRSWWCCIKDQRIQQFETKQLTISDDWRYNKFKSTTLDKNRAIAFI